VAENNNFHFSCLCFKKTVVEALPYYTYVHSTNTVAEQIMITQL